MKKTFLVILLLFALAVPARAMDFQPPAAPDSVEDLVPVEPESFGADLWELVKKAIGLAQPELLRAGGGCLTVLAMVLLTGVLRGLPGNMAKITDLAAVFAVGTMLLNQTGSMITMAAETVTQLSEYGKLLLPVMTAAMAAQGGITASAAIYAATAAFDAVLCAAITKLLIPMIYVFLVLSAAACATGEGLLKKIRDLVKWLASWGLKAAMYIFTGYLGITGVISGTVDAAAVKATKLTISGMIPVVGGILADASETVIVGARVMKNAAGVYGLLALIAIFITPFLMIGAQYLLLKLTAALCDAFEAKTLGELVRSFSTAMGLLAGMTGAVCMILMISTVCFMKGVS